VPGPNRAGYFNQYSQGKRSITLNLTNPKGVAIALELVRHCDIVVENFSAGVMERIGLGYKRLCEYRPDLIMVSISGFGQTGPCRSYVSYGPSAESMAGVCCASGYEGGPPTDLGTSYTDPNAGILGASAVMAALLRRRATGEGQYIDVSQLEGAVVLMPESLLEFAINEKEPKRIGNHDPWMAPHECYKAKGDAEKWVSIAVGSEQEWQALCKVIDAPELADDPRFRTMTLRKQNEAALDQIVTAWTCERDRWEVTEALQAAGVAAFPAMSNQDMATNRHLLERGYLVMLEHAEVGRRIHAGIPWTMSRTPCKVRTPAPLLGADTKAVLVELLGYTDEQVRLLEQEGLLC
jgi:benzylsuccinate CoA-transferase BbsF subunit